MSRAIARVIRAPKKKNKYKSSKKALSLPRFSRISRGDHFLLAKNCLGRQLNKKETDKSFDPYQSSVLIDH